MSEVLSIHDAHAIGRIIEACWSGRKVSRLMEESGDIIEGVARSIGDDRGNFLASGEDVREGKLRVTTTMGWEVFWPMRELIADHQQATFIIHES
jgi:hypothetical protein